MTDVRQTSQNSTSEGPQGLPLTFSVASVFQSFSVYGLLFSGGESGAIATIEEVSTTREMVLALSTAAVAQRESSVSHLTGLTVAEYMAYNQVTACR